MQSDWHAPQERAIFSLLCRLVTGYLANRNMTRWSEFQGYAFLPGIEEAQFETRTPDMIGSRVRVRNTDGSQHVEEIIAWDPDREIAMKLQEFTPPLNRLATHFIEHWRLAPQGDATLVTRKFQMHPTNALTRFPLWVISLVFRRAIAAHLDHMAR